MNLADLPDILDARDVAGVLGVSTDAVYRLFAEGAIQGAFRVGRRWRIARVRFVAYVNQADLPSDDATGRAADGVEVVPGRPMPSRSESGHFEPDLDVGLSNA